MAPSSVRVPSPTLSDSDREPFAVPTKTKYPTSKMLNIQALLNPSKADSMSPQSPSQTTSPPLTPAFSVPGSTPSASPRYDSADTLTKGRKAVKNPVVDAPGEIKGVVDFPPHECTEHIISLSLSEQIELHRQHKLFNITPNGRGRQGRIRDYPKTIPYSSEKKGWCEKSGRQGFNVFKYTFSVPGNPKEYAVLWDYNNGLVRMTPFFKACYHTKTTPAKALNANPGLKELAHSITGGAILAQGYWIPYPCARALCTTFCYDIRFALTPVFGPDFIKECLPPNSTGFCRFKINPEIVRFAELQDYRCQPSPQDSKTGESVKEIPRSVPQGHETAAMVELRSRAARPTFKQGSPFDTDSDASGQYSWVVASPSTTATPEISPKSSAYGVGTPAWTSINRSYTPPPAPTNTPVDPLSRSLLAQPRYASWRPATAAESSQPRTIKMPTGAHDKHRMHKRRRSSTENEAYAASNKVTHSGSDAGISSSESDYVDIQLPVDPVKKYALRKRSSLAPAPVPKKRKGGKSVKFTSEDHWAARQLLKLANDVKMASVTTA